LNDRGNEDPGTKTSPNTSSHKDGEELHSPGNERTLDVQNTSLVLRTGPSRKKRSQKKDAFNSFRMGKRRKRDSNPKKKGGGTERIKKKTI